MSFKKFSRVSPVITKEGSSVQKSGDVSDWMSNFLNSLEKNATRSAEEDKSMFGQISQILGNKPKYSNVEEAVLDMQKRSGLYDFLTSAKVDDKLTKKQANNVEALDYEGIKDYIQNYVRSFPGSPAHIVLENLANSSVGKKVPKEKLNKELVEYINDIINSSVTKYQTPPVSVGKIDTHDSEGDISANDDFFKSCITSK